MQTIQLHNSYFHAAVDDTDFESINKFIWYPQNHGTSVYAAKGTWGDNSYTTMSNFLMGFPPEGHVWDHRDGDGLNCQRSNLRLATRSQNLSNRGKQRNNTSGYKNVFWHKNTKKWKVQIRVSGTLHYGGYYETSQEAARAADELAIRLLGEFAHTNFPRADYL